MVLPRIHEHAPRVFEIFLEPFIARFDIGSVEKFQHARLQLSAALTCDNFNLPNVLLYGTLDGVR